MLPPPAIARRKRVGSPSWKRSSNRSLRRIVIVARSNIFTALQPRRRQRALAHHPRNCNMPLRVTLASGYIEVRSRGGHVVMGLRYTHTVPCMAHETYSLKYKLRIPIAKLCVCVCVSVLVCVNVCFCVRVSVFLIRNQI